MEMINMDLNMNISIKKQHVHLFYIDLLVTVPLSVNVGYICNL